MGFNRCRGHRVMYTSQSVLFFITICLSLIISCTTLDKQEETVYDSLSSATFSSVDPKKIDDFINAKMKGAEIPGISIAIVQRGNILYTNCYGLANLEHAVPVTPESPFKIASLTKPITAIATMQLVEKDMIDLDQHIGYYLDNLPEEWEAITVRQLLSHTSGLADYFQAPDWSWRNSWRLDLTHDEFIKMNAKSPKIFESGEKMKYCNTNYYLLGMLIEKVSGKNYAKYLTDHIFEPLGMSNSRLDNAKAIIANRVTGYTLEEGVLKNAEFTSDTWAYSEGGVITTAEDLAKLDSSLYTEKLLKKRSIELMWTPTKLNDGSYGVIGDNGAGKPNYYGLGWFISDYKDHRLILAGGNKPGYTCTFFRFVDNDLSIIVLSNLSSSPVYGIAGEIAEMYLNK